MMEPSFFYGAMYVSYALTVAIAVASFIISNVFLGLSLDVSFASIIGALIIFTPVTIRLSRLIWINIFVKYKKEI